MTDINSLQEGNGTQEVDSGDQQITSMNNNEQNDSSASTASIPPNRPPPIPRLTRLIFKGRMRVRIRKFYIYRLIYRIKTVSEFISQNLTLTIFSFFIHSYYDIYI